MFDVGLAKTYLECLRVRLESGRELEPHQLDDLLAIAHDENLPRYVRRDAARMADVELGA